MHSSHFPATLALDQTSGHAVATSGRVSDIELHLRAHLAQMRSVVNGTPLAEKLIWVL